MSKRILFSWVILLLVLPIFVYSQTRQITGTIRDANGQPVPLATIQQKGTQNAVTAEMNGTFSITVTGNNPVLVISSASFETVEYPLGTGNTVDISLSASGSLSEVVVTALGIKRSERSLGYSTQEIKGENLTMTKEQNVLGSLAGKIAGVQVVGSSGASMGGTQKIKIRGVNSITGASNPLIVVDGTPISNANYAGSAKAD